MAPYQKVTSLKFNNRARVIYDNDCIAGVEYENENENYSENIRRKKTIQKAKMMKMILALF